jgi:hypothetical protein
VLHDRLHCSTGRPGISRCLGSCAGIPEDGSDLRRRSTTIHVHLSRGQPDAAGFQFLRNLGIRTVVSFRNDDSERAQVDAGAGRIAPAPFVGLYRVLRQGWDLERAYNEAREIGMRWWYPAVKGELEELARAFSRRSLSLAR